MVRVVIYKRMWASVAVLFQFHEMFAIQSPFPQKRLNRAFTERMSNDRAN